MDGVTEMGVALAVGLVLGYAVAAVSRRKPRDTGEQDASTMKWWDVRKTLTGTQLQILQYMEARKEATITALQEKFSFIPDRELYYRLEQIVLLGFIRRDKRHDEAVYTLNANYAKAVEDDKTITLSQV